MSRPLQILCTVLAAASLAAAADLGQLQQSFMKRYDEANATRDDSLKKLESSYLGALKRHMDKVKASGRLELVVPVRDEIEAVEGRVDPLPVLPENTSYDLEQLRKTYETARRQVVTDHAEAILGLAEKMTDALEKQEAELTKAGKIDEALAAKRMRETLGQDAGIQAARERLQAVKRAGKALPALRIRRCGDDLEVIVYYDRNGKVSMDSPVENVRESGEKQGDTNAKVLGEFVGAEGYEVDPYVSYHHVFDGDDLGAIRNTEVDVRPGVAVKGRTGIGLTISKQPTNPHLNFGPILPTADTPAVFVVKVRYLVPSGNRHVAGILLAQAGMGPIQGGRLVQKPGWQEATIEAAGRGPKSSLLLYLVKEEGAAVIGGEFVVLAELEVNWLKFSAFVVENFSDGKEVGSDSKIVNSGEFVGF